MLLLGVGAPGGVPGLHRVLLGGQAERVPADRVQDVEAPGAPVAGDDVRRGVALGMADVQPRPRGVGKHVEHVVFGPRGCVFRPERAVFFPERLPVGLDF